VAKAMSSFNYFIRQLKLMAIFPLTLVNGQVE